jgi:ferredoxin
MKIAVDRAKCISAANCIGIAKKTFKLDLQKKVVLLDPKAHDDGTLFEAAESCPTEAIVLTDEESGEQVFP